MNVAVSVSERLTYVSLSSARDGAFDGRKCG